MVWYDIKNKKPIAYKTGCWDGKKSDKFLACTSSGRYHIVEMYEGIIDGKEFCNFYDANDFDIHNIAYWSEITSPL